MQSIILSQFGQTGKSELKHYKIQFREKTGFVKKWQTKLVKLLKTVKIAQKLQVGKWNYFLISKWIRMIIQNVKD